MATQSEWVNINGVYVKKSDAVQTRAKGMWPYGHAIYKFMAPDITIDEMDKIYHEEFTHKDSLHLDYNKSVRAAGFALMMSKGLAEKGTIQQKKYYIEEQLSIKPGIAGIENFYELLLSLANDYSTKEVENLAKRFYDKNLEEIESGEYYTADNKFMHRLDKSYNEFKNALAMK